MIGRLRTWVGMDTIHAMRRRLWHDDLPQYWTTQDVARELGVSRGAVRLWIDRRELLPDAWYAYGESRAPLFLPEHARQWGKTRGLC